MPSKESSYLKRFFSVLLTDQDIIASEFTDNQDDEAQAVPELINEDIPDWLTESVKDAHDTPTAEQLEPVEEVTPLVQTEPLLEPVINETKKVKKSPKNLKEALMNGENFWHEETQNPEIKQPIADISEDKNVITTTKKNKNQKKKKKKINKK